jgi:polyhydroxybutyrate depolymerase
VPPSYTPQGDFPLVILLHGKGNSGKVMMDQSGFNDLADSKHFLAVYPNALGNPTVWNTGFNSDTRALTDDIGFIKALIAHLESELAVDPRRIYMVGFSNGAIMTYRYAVEPGNRLAAIAAVAGTVGIYTSGYKKDFIELPPKPLPVLSIFGGDDVGIPLVGEPVPTSPLLSVTDSVQFWVYANGCRPGSQRDTSANGKVIRDSYTGCRDGADVVSYILTDTGHVWPELARDKLSASTAIWEFFTHYEQKSTF